MDRPHLLSTRRAAFEFLRERHESYLLHRGRCSKQDSTFRSRATSNSIATHFTLTTISISYHCTSAELSAHASTCAPLKYSTRSVCLFLSDAYPHNERYLYLFPVSEKSALLDFAERLAESFFEIAQRAV